MPFSIKFDTVKSEWPIIYIERSQVISFESNGFLSLKIPFVLANSADPEKCHIMRYFTRVFTVCQYCLRIFCDKMVNGSGMPI